jgi:hypothetical protein
LPERSPLRGVHCCSRRISAMSRGGSSHCRASVSR